MNPASKRAAWIGTALMLAGWVIAALGFANADEIRPVLPEAARVGVRVFGLVVLMTGATITVYTTLGGPTVVIVFGVVLNLAHQAGLMAQPATGIFGAGVILLGALWASRRIRALEA